MPERYKRAPITEAVIEIRYAGSVESDLLAKVSADFKAVYPLHDPLVNYDVTVGLPPPNVRREAVTQVNQATGHRLSSRDQAEILLLWPVTFVVSQLAPYPGWEMFFGRFGRDWTIWKKAAGYRKITRIGVRFVNRIDIPQADRMIEETDYLGVYAKLPEAFGPVTAYGVQAQFPPDDEGCRLTLNSGSVPSPLVDHSSVLLDIDIAKEVSPPQNDEEIFVLLDNIRTKKNVAFESCITEQARELFRR
jgi:uncharacterized protein (TIGR04255 family)